MSNGTEFDPRRDLPDWPRIENIARRLWSGGPSGRAAAMIGAGFSRNAVPVVSDGRRFPLWGPLVAQMHEALYGAEEGGAVTSAPRLASEYEQAFRRDALNEFIRDALPDQLFRPGRHHRLLLSLPWAEIVTTNYDTLLERTAEVTTIRRYDLVRRPDDLARARRPRIVKLHGSLPDQLPFIITEEDYRTYPARFAPFVNLVQQSLMENSLVLLGFSGDDPNFSAWTGWVRDNLGENMPAVYQVGLLGLSASERSLFESRSILPVDLAPLVRDRTELDRDSRHAYALEWFLAALHAFAPPDVRAWPRLARSRPTQVDDLPAVPFPTPVDQSVGRPPPSISPTGLSEAVAQQLVEQWSAERNAYPGWVVCPRRNRFEIWHATSPVCTHIARGLAGLNWVLAISLASELAWRLAVCFRPLSAVEGLVPAFRDCFDQIPEAGVSVLDLERWTRVGEALLRQYRLRFDFSAHSDIARHVRERVGARSDLIAVTGVEQALAWSILGRSDRHRGALAPIEGEPNEHPSVELGRTALLLEGGALDVASERLRTGLTWARRVLLTEQENVEQMSRERALALQADWLAQYRDRDLALLGVSRGSRAREHDLSASVRDEVLHYQADLWTEVEEVSGLLDRSPSSAGRDFTGFPAFDPELGPARSQPEYRSMRRVRLLDEYVGYELMGVTESGGIPLCIDGSPSLGELLDRACVWLVRTVPGSCFAMTLRACSENSAKAWLTRRAAVELEQELVERVWAAVWPGFGQTLPRLESPHREVRPQPRQERWLSTAAELLSRIAFRMGRAQRLEFARRAIALLEHAARTGDSYRLSVGHRHLARAVLALEIGDQVLMLPDLAELPVPDQGHETEWLSKEPLAWIRLPDAVTLPGEVSNRLREAIRNALAALTGGQNRRRLFAAYRLELLESLGLLTASERDEFGSGLWAYRDRDCDEGLPAGTNMRACAFLSLPSPPDVDVEPIVRRRLHELVIPSVEAIATAQTQRSLIPDLDFFHEWLGAANFLRPQAVFQVTATDLLFLYDRLEEHAAAVVPELQSSRSELYTDALDQELRMSVLVCSLVVAPYTHQLRPDLLPRLHSIIDMIASVGVDTFPAAVPLRLFEGTSAELLGTETRQRMRSSDEDTVALAAVGLYRWVALASRLDIAPPPLTCLDELIARCGHGVEPGLSRSLQVVGSLVRDYPATFDDDQVSQLILDIRRLRLRLDAMEWRPGEPDLEWAEQHRLVARVVCLLRAALDELDRPSERVDGLIDELRSAVLPEVRREVELVSVADSTGSENAEE